MSALAASNLPGGAEQPLCPPDAPEWCESELQRLGEAAALGFDIPDRFAERWLREQLVETPNDVARLFMCALIETRDTVPPNEAMLEAYIHLRDRFIAECATDYADEVSP